jgi:two-component system, cell cycle sensor histidine kinase and response regulator CckA
VKTILLLEDESTLMNLLRQMLGPYRVIEATTAKQALQLFSNHNRRIDLLIADLTLPDSSGIHAALILRSENPSLPVIVTSGYPVSTWTVRDVLDLERLGPATILSKPFRSQELLQAVVELIGAPTSEAARSA